MSEVTNGELLKDIHEKVIRFDQWRESVDEKLDVVAEVFKPNGVCSKARSAISGVKVQVGIQWVVLLALLTYLIIRQVA